jgi:Fe-S cluster biogenesis protein NfuA
VPQLIYKIPLSYLYISNQAYIRMIRQFTTGKLGSSPFKGQLYRSVVLRRSILTQVNKVARVQPVLQIPKWLTSSRRNLYIQTATTPNDDALKFLPSQEILGEGKGTVEFLSGREAHGSPLARKLFAVDGLKSVMFGADFITVEKDPETSWMIMKPEIFSILTEHLSAGGPILTEGTAAAQDTMPNEDDSEVVSMIKELIDTRVRPAIQEDGGDIEYRGFTDDGIVQLKLRGACRSCDSSAVTLKNGIESMLMHYVEEVNGVEQVLDVEEQVAMEEFAKLEQKLSGTRNKSEEMSPSL